MMNVISDAVHNNLTTDDDESQNSDTSRRSDNNIAYDEIENDKNYNYLINVNLEEHLPPKFGNNYLHPNIIIT